MKRVLSLDVFRGLVILAMLFVNDLAGVKGVPSWLLHAPTDHDGMTFVDMVFPAFLFMVGMAIPYALERRERPWPHVLARAASLVFLGFLEINGERMAPGRGLPPDLWYLLETAGVLLVWNGGWKPPLARSLRWAGWGLLALCLVLYSGPAGSGPLALRPGWGGILGLIGWAYLAACLVYLPGRGRVWAVPSGLVLFLVLTAAVQGGWLAGVPFMDRSWNPLVTFPPHGALVLAGVALGLLVRSDRPLAAAALGAVLLLVSVLVHRPGGILIISKNLATVTWCLRASGYAALLWLALYLAVDRGGWRPGTAFLREAGGNALLAYLLAPAAVALAALLCAAAGHAGAYDRLGQTFRWGLARAAGHALLLTWLAGALRRRGVLLKL